MHAFGAPAQLADSLRSAQHQHGQERQFAAAQIQSFAQAMSVFFDAMARAGDLQHELLLPQELQALCDSGFVVVHHGFAAGFLVAGGLQRVQRKRVILGRRQVFFE